MTAATDKGYHVVAATDDERAAWVRKHPRQAPPSRVQCDRCGVRYWLSGLGVGSHNRSLRHAEG